MSPSLHLIGSRLKEYRKYKKYTLVKLAEYAGITHSAMSGLENGKSKPSYDTLYNLCKNTDINIYWLFFNEGQMTFSEYNKKYLFSDDNIKRNEFEEELSSLRSEIDNLKDYCNFNKKGNVA